nr:unnamed protein product [Spirometra erinaceieuropaei]
MIFAARQLQENRQELRTHLFHTFVDLTKAFESVNREADAFPIARIHNHCSRTSLRRRLRPSEEGMRRSMDLFSAAYENFGLVINTEKTIVMRQPPPNTVTPPQCTAH